MTIQLSVAARDGGLDAFETAAGTAAHLKIYTGAQPANCAATESGTLLCDITLPSDWMAAAASGSKSMSGTWAGTGAAAGTAGHFRIYDSAGANCHCQGSITATGSGGDMTLDNTSIASAQAVSISSFTLTAGNA